MVRQTGVIPTGEFFPDIAQGIAVSDQVLKEKPDIVHRFLQASLHGMKDILEATDGS